MDTLRRNIRDLDFTMFGVLILLGVFACLAIQATTHGNPNPNIPPHPLKKQITWEIVGMVVMVIGTLFDYRWLRRVHWWIYGVSIVLLFAVYGFSAVQGAHSWIRLPGIQFQPSELAKLGLIIWLAAFMANIDESEEPVYGLRKTWIIVPIFFVPFALIYLEPALGQALVIIAITLTMYTAFAKRSHFIWIMSGVIVVIAAACLAATLYTHQIIHFINNVVIKHHIIKQYQMNRILTWLDPNFSPNNYGYTIHMASTAIGSGQLFGEGFGNGLLTRGGWVPNQWTDYIFSAIGEEFGFVGASVLILLFLMLCHRIIRIAGTTSDVFGMYISIGVVGMFSFQVFENIGADMYLSPSTGITLPFISYGGTSLAVNYLAIGLILSVGLRRRKLRFN